MSFALVPGGPSGSRSAPLPAPQVLEASPLSAGVLLACVPNVSLGPQDEALEPVLAAVREATSPGCRLLDTHTDRDHRRTVLTLAGAPVPLLDVMTRLAEALAGHGSLQGHEGVHPRVGLLDVVPFVALDGARGETHRLARAFADRMAAGEVPVYAYAGLTPGLHERDLVEVRRELADTRPGEQAPLAPDLGPERLHPAMGACCVGVREPLVAYNVLLDTDDPAVGEAIARSVRASSGGMPGVQALAFPLASREGRVQVSTNITAVEQASVDEVYERVRREASERGVAVVEGELVGLAPRQALPTKASVAGLTSPPMSLEDALADAGFPVDEVR